ncbi:GNAT family N-acetyltransferase [Vibrio sp. SCSIO 43136]|nr:GNAT family N-acetyltransferase [Vibrio sp. SCSIO 43136]
MQLSTLSEHPHEIEKIAQWYFDEWAHTAPNMTQAMVARKVTEKSIHRDQFPMALVAHQQDQLAGVLELKYRENKYYPQYEHWVGGVFIDPSYRNQGIASQLLLRAKQLAAKFGVTELYLQCESFNIALYQKHGFKALHLAPHHDIETTIMVCEVTN